ncbi:2-dehydropantoate 2-reductase [Metabacillus litoralis]|uniref:2-dehydropantoate 2-reductase n=1 Tax=Metabacillus litoralis TaxID=152268 RepID=UPI00203B13DF|nr:2-dehydropantoate 2-reductase [Metabacillus litoralis]MCM3408973.1 2-dehydropantoate 2-reductase [Metabacillus litoralis]
MEIGIIGSGSLGLLYSFYLSENNKVTLYSRREEQASKINKHGITLVQGNSEMKKNVEATFEKNYKEPVLIITVKQYSLKPIIDTLTRLSPRTIIFLQNGMGHLRFLKHLSHHNLILGISEHGALKVSDSVVQHTGNGITKISSYKDCEMDVMNQIIRNHSEVFPFIRKSDWERMLKEKLIVNATINPLTALFRVKNGELITNPYFHKLFYELFEEVADLLKIENKELSWKQVKTICENTSENKSSMYKDIYNGRQTEIDSILGYIIDLSNGKSCPRISFLYQAIKGIEIGKEGV